MPNPTARQTSGGNPLQSVAGVYDVLGIEPARGCAQERHQVVAADVHRAVGVTDRQTFPPTWTRSRVRLDGVQPGDADPASQRRQLASSCKLTADCAPRRLRSRPRRCGRPGRSSPSRRARAGCNGLHPRGLPHSPTFERVCGDVLSGGAPCRAQARESGSVAGGSAASRVGEGCLAERCLVRPSSPRFTPLSLRLLSRFSSPLPWSSSVPRRRLRGAGGQCPSCADRIALRLTFAYSAGRALWAAHSSASARTRRDRLSPWRSSRAADRGCSRVGRAPFGGCARAFAAGGLPRAG